MIIEEQKPLISKKFSFVMTEWFKELD